MCTVDEEGNAKWKVVWKENLENGVWRGRLAWDIQPPLLLSSLSTLNDKCGNLSGDNPSLQTCSLFL